MPGGPSDGAAAGVDCVGAGCDAAGWEEEAGVVVGWAGGAWPPAAGAVEDPVASNAGGAVPAPRSHDSASAPAEEAR